MSNPEGGPGWWHGHRIERAERSEEWLEAWNTDRIETLSISPGATKPEIVVLEEIPPGSSYQFIPRGTPAWSQKYIPPTYVVAPPGCTMWQRWPGESIKSYDKFTAFLQLGPTRSVSQMYEAATSGTGKGRVAAGSFILNAARDWYWPWRALAWDDRQRQIEAEELEATKREMIRRHAEAGVKLQERALTALLSLTDSRFSPEDILQYVLKGIEVEAKARGVDLQKLTGPPSSPGGDVNVTNVIQQATLPFTPEAIQAMMSRESLVDMTPRVIKTEVMDDGLAEG